MKYFVRETPDKFKEYLKENWGAPFITGFMVLLISSAALMVTSSTSLANEFAIYAYFALVVGVVLQLFCFLRCSKKNGEKKDDSS